MNVDWKRAEEMALALMFLTTFEEQGQPRTWKGFGWDLLQHLHEDGFISNPVGKAKSVGLTPEGRALSERLFRARIAQAG